VDPYVRERVKANYRARSAFKLLEMHDKLRLVRKGNKVVDLGAAPGGWAQVVLEKLEGSGKLVMCDLLEIDSFEDERARFVQGDFLDPLVREEIAAAAGGRVDLVLSDMAHNTIGDRTADHHLQIELARQALDTAKALLRPQGAFLVKVFDGAEEPAFAKEMKATFQRFQRIKPASSRDESRELFMFGRKLKA